MEKPEGKGLEDWVDEGDRDKVRAKDKAHISDSTDCVEGDTTEI